MSNKRAMYVALQHLQLAVDVVVEDDVLESGFLSQYKVLYVVDMQVSDAAAVALTSWVNSGGKLYVTCAAGLLNEYNATNTGMGKLLGTTMGKIIQPPAAGISYVSTRS
jgi:beta-galactosidase GanA